MEQKMMKALVYQGPHKYDLMDVPVPAIIDPTDVIGRVTLAAICTSDIHLVNGEMPNGPYPRITGHEFCVEILETGSEVKKYRVGDRCVVKPGASCGECTMCKLGLRSLCPKGGVFGSIGTLEGCHAEYVRVPFADWEGQMYKIPEGLSEEDVILLPDMLGTAWLGIKNAELTPEKTIAVVGMGPVGQSVCLLAKKAFGAKKVIALDIVQDRVDLAVNEGIADIGIHLATEDAAQKIREATGGMGVDAAIETAGVAAGLITSSAITRPGGIISSVSLFNEQYVGLPMNEMIAKGLKLKFGVQQCEGVPEMFQMIQEGKLDAKFLLTHRSPLNDIKKGFEIFGNRQDGCIKWAITPYER